MASLLFSRLAALGLYSLGLALALLALLGWTAERDLHGTFSAWLLSTYNFSLGALFLTGGCLSWMHAPTGPRQLVDMMFLITVAAAFAAATDLAYLLGHAIVRSIYQPALLIEWPAYLPMYLLLALVPVGLVVLTLSPMLTDLWAAREVVNGPLREWVRCSSYSQVSSDEPFLVMTTPDSPGQLV
jgi:hypothetical protein